MAKSDRQRVTFTLRNIEQRADESSGKKTISGYIPYNSRSVDFGWGFYEKLSPGCFSKTLNDKAEVRAFHNHNANEVLGNTRSGTLVLTDSGDGLRCVCEIPNTSYGNDLYEVIKRGDCRTMSFGMYIVKCEYEDKPDNTTIRTITEAALDEVSFGVAYPAYPETDSSADLRSWNPSEMTERMKEFVLTLADKIKAETKAETEPPEDTRQEPSSDTPTQGTESQDGENERRAKAEADADAFLFEQTN